MITRSGTDGTGDVFTCVGAGDVITTGGGWFATGGGVIGGAVLVGGVIAGGAIADRADGGGVIVGGGVIIGAGVSAAPGAAESGIGTLVETTPDGLPDRGGGLTGATGTAPPVFTIELMAASLARPIVSTLAELGTGIVARRAGVLGNSFTAAAG